MLLPRSDMWPPHCAAAVAIDGYSSYTSHGGATMAHSSRGRILLVEGDAGEAASHTRVLGEAGFEVQAASDSGGARSLLARERFDAVLSVVSTPAGASGLL